MTDIHAPNLLASNTEGKTLYYRQQFQIFHQQFQVHYQPVVSLLNQQIHSFEALLRWRQGYSLLDPAEFIPLAEETGLIIPLGYWVLEETRLNTVRISSKHCWEWHTPCWRWQRSISPI